MYSDRTPTGLNASSKGSFQSLVKNALILLEGLKLQCLVAFLFSFHVVVISILTYLMITVGCRNDCRRLSSAVAEPTKEQCVQSKLPEGRQLHPAAAVKSGL